MHIVESLAIEASYDIHNVLVDDGTVESARLRLLSRRLELGESPLLNVKLVDIVEALLVGVNAAKYVDVAPADDSRVPVPGLRR